MHKPTAFQMGVAGKLGVSLRGASRAVAAARIYDAVEAALHPGIVPRGPTEKQVKFASDLGVYKRGDSFRVCAARIAEELRRRNAAAIRRMRLKPGDFVEKRHSFEVDGRHYERTTHHIVSSIGEDLRVYFKNPIADSGAWPSQLTKTDISQALCAECSLRPQIIGCPCSLTSALGRHDVLLPHVIAGARPVAPGPPSIAFHHDRPQTRRAARAPVHR